MLTDAGSRAVWLKVCVAISWLSASRRCTVAQLLPEPPDTNHVKGTLHLQGGAEEVEARVGWSRCGCRVRVLPHRQPTCPATAAHPPGFLNWLTTPRTAALAVTEMASSCDSSTNWGACSGVGRSGGGGRWRRRRQVTRAVLPGARAQFLRITSTQPHLCGVQAARGRVK